MITIKKCLMHFDSDARVFVLSNWHKRQLCDKTPFSQLQFGLKGCMILMKEYVSLTTATMKMSQIHFFSDHNNGC